MKLRFRRAGEIHTSADYWLAGSAAMINTSAHYTSLHTSRLHSPLGKLHAAHNLSESSNVPRKPGAPAAALEPTALEPTALEYSRLRLPGPEIRLEEKRSKHGSAPDEADTVDKPQESRRERERLELHRAEIAELAARDREVRAHEQAHIAVGGPYAGGARYQYQRGPDGVNYAVSGEVSIDVSKAATPEATMAKAQTVRRAALAPAEPSPQDLQVAAQATLLENQARQELVAQRVQDAPEKKAITDAGTANAKRDSVAKSEQDSTQKEIVEAPAASRAVDDIGSPAQPFVNSRLASGIDNTRFTTSRVGKVLDQLA